ncbi:MAG: molecular chaperone DnaJ [Halothece sp.]
MVKEKEYVEKMNPKSNKIEPNPYDVLGVSQSASNAEITKAFAMAMKRKEYPVDVIAKARKALMNPQQRLIADYLRPILPTAKPFQRGDYSELEKPAPVIEILEEFEGLKNVLPSQNTVSNTDKQLGRMFFNCRNNDS